MSVFTLSSYTKVSVFGGHKTRSVDDPEQKKRKELKYCRKKNEKERKTKYKEHKTKQCKKKQTNLEGPKTETPLLQMTKKVRNITRSNHKNTRNRKIHENGETTRQRQIRIKATKSDTGGEKNV